MLIYINNRLKNLKGVNGYSIGGSDARHNKHVVARLSGLIGEEEASVVIAGALHLNGAMIAAAHKDENGVYTDHGNLVLKVGELFWQHYSALQSFLKKRRLCKLRLLCLA